MLVIEDLLALLLRIVDHHTGLVRLSQHVRCLLLCEGDHLVSLDSSVGNRRYRRILNLALEEINTQILDGVADKFAAGGDDKEF